MRTCTGKILSFALGLAALAVSLSVIHEAQAVSWVATGAMGTARYCQTATLLPNGKVLVAGGGGAVGSALSSAELYDPASGTWTATGPLTDARVGHTATLLPNGNALVAGGDSWNGWTDDYLSSTELYDDGDLTAFRITSLLQQGNNILITWTTYGGMTNVVQGTTGGVGGSYSNNFTDLSPQIISAGTSETITNYLHVGGATVPARYYRIRLAVP